jgi:hypothetical protein
MEYCLFTVMFLKPSVPMVHDPQNFTHSSTIPHSPNALRLPLHNNKAGLCLRLGNGFWNN